MTPDPHVPPTACPRCSRSAADSLHYAVATMMAATHYARSRGEHKLAAELKASYFELMLLITPPAAEPPAELRRAA